MNEPVKSDIPRRRRFSRSEGTARVSLTIPGAALMELRRIAEERGISVAAVCSLAVEAYVQKTAPTPEQTTTRPEDGYIVHAVGPAGMEGTVLVLNPDGSIVAMDANVSDEHTEAATGQAAGRATSKTKGLLQIAERFSRIAKEASQDRVEARQSKTRHSRPRAGDESRVGAAPK